MKPIVHYDYKKMNPTAYKFTTNYGTFFTEVFSDIADDPEVEEWTPLYNTIALLDELAKTLKEQLEDYTAKCNELELVWDEFDKCTMKCAELTKELEVLKPKKMTEEEFIAREGKRLREAREKRLEIEQLYKDQGICPECEGEKELGGQFTGGTWKCESCNGTGKYEQQNQSS